MRKPRLGVFFLIDFLNLASGFNLTVILGSGSISVKDIQTYLCNLTEAEPEPKPNRANNTENADNTNNADNTDDAKNAENAENTNYYNTPSPYHMTWPISRLLAPINFIYIQHPSSIVLKSNTP